MLHYIVTTSLIVIAALAVLFWDRIDPVTAWVDQQIAANKAKQKNAVCSGAAGRVGPAGH